MKFDNNVENGFEVVREKDYDRLFTDKNHLIACSVCGEGTAYCLLKLPSPICSHECADKLWESYLQGLGVAGEEIRELGSGDVEKDLETKIKSLQSKIEPISTLSLNELSIFEGETVN